MSLDKHWKKSTIKFTINHPPAPKRTPEIRVVKKWSAKKKRHMHIPVPYPNKETVAASNTIATLASIYKPSTPWEGPLAIKATFYRRIPGTWSGKKKVMAEDGVHVPTSKPDNDNYMKMLGDALEGLFYKNDSQIIDNVLSKRYSKDPRIEIELTFYYRPQEQKPLFRGGVRYESK